MTDDFSLDGITTYSLHDRPSKVAAADLGRPLAPGAGVEDWIDSLPRQLAANELRAVREVLTRAYRRGDPVVAALGGHVIKTGCGPYLADWMRRGLVGTLVLNGAAAIHDVELAIAGRTSEDVSATLRGGTFGFARETAEAFAEGARLGAHDGRGLGRALGEYLGARDCPHGDASILLAAHRCGVTCTVHVAVGTDIVHMHPRVSGADTGEASLVDFRKVCGVVAGMNRGVWMNLGSAVLLPEVLLKAVSVARNLGYPLDEMVTVNLDKKEQYRSAVNVLERPGSKGLQLIGHHEILIPLLHAAVAGVLARGRSVGRAA